MFIYCKISFVKTISSDKLMEDNMGYNTNKEPNLIMNDHIKF